MHHLATYFHGSPAIAANALSPAAILAVPVLGTALIAIQRRRRARASRD